MEEKNIAKESGLKIAFISLGCDKNLVDSEVMLGILDREGYTLTPNEAAADIIIVNTCGFILEATDEGVQTVLKAAEYKEQGRLKKLIVTGCMAQRYGGEIMKEIPEVDAVVGTGDFEAIGSVIREVSQGGKVEAVTDINRLIKEENSENRRLSTPSYFAYMKIAEGCDNRCTYCTIPSLRGKYRSRHIKSLVKEGESLAAQGVKELILVAQDTALYGRDLYGQSMLHQLLHHLSEISGIEWIRILYCYPEHITAETINEMAANPKVCHYLDMPIQHSENSILKRMGRRSTREGLKAVIGSLREAMPDIALRTTLITGFPGESEDEFQGLVDFISEIKFDRLGVFAYSREDGTPAYQMDGQIEEEEKARRRDYILDLQKAVSSEKCSAMVGKTLRCIVEGRLPEENIYCGRSYMDCYEIDGMVFFHSEEEIISGEFRDIKIAESSDYDLIGEIVYESAQ